MRRHSGAEAALSVFDRQDDVVPGSPEAAVRLAEALQAVEPTWAEAVAIVQAVCARLEPERTPPAIGDIRISARGQVTFAPGGLVDRDVAIQLTARLLARLAGGDHCPFEVSESIERAALAPMSFGSTRGFGDALTCIPRERAVQCLASYVRRVQRVLSTPNRPPPRHVAPRGIRTMALDLLTRLRARRH